MANTGDVIEWYDFDNNKKIGLVLDTIEDALESDMRWLYVFWHDGSSYIRSTEIKKLSSVSI
jgi:hypothetical protein